MNAITVDALAAQEAAGLVGSLTGAMVRLLKADFTLTRDRVLADLTEADFDGYVAVGPTAWTDGQNPDAEHIVMPTTLLQWNGADPQLTPNTLYGVAVEVGGLLLALAKFDVPFAVDVPDQLVQLTLQYTVESALWDARLIEP